MDLTYHGTAQSETRTTLPDGNFPIPRPVNSLAFTGERMTTERKGQVEFEHFHRYCLARDLCVGKDVLDVASGEGYGAALLAGVARRVSGLEINADVVAHAIAGYHLSNLEFLQGDAHTLPFPDASFDVVVSFETLEHLRDQVAFLAEVKRVMRPDGVVIISTPDRAVYSAPGQQPNRYHVLELSYAEFTDRLGTFFRHHRVLRQRILLGSVVGADDVLDVPSAWRSYDRRSYDHIEATAGLARAFYLIGIASDAALPVIGNSFYGDNRPIDDLVAASVQLPPLRQQLDSVQSQLAETERQADRARADAKQAHAEAIGRISQEARKAKHDANEARRHVQQTVSELKALSRRHDDLDHHAQALSDQLAMREWQLEVGHQGRLALERLLDGIRRNPWWRLGGPLRIVARRLAMQKPALPPNLPPPPVPKALAKAMLDPPAFDLRAELGLPPIRETLPPAASIAFRQDGEAPVVSVIIPTFGQVDYTLRCLASLAAALPRVPTEVIVIDDASDDPRVAELAAVRGIRLIVQTENLGFLRSCNFAAARAKGRYLMLLNNDTEVMPRAIDALHGLLVRRPDAGLVGAQLLYPDGLLQEAGGIVWRDGSAWNYGNRDDPRKPEYNYVREADYISGAAIMVPLSVWNELGGFDKHYLPAYCEDSDLAFRIRASGRKVLYQPAARVIHFEGVSHGVDVSVGLKAYQTTNTAKFYARWRGMLRGSQLPSGTRTMRARDRALRRTVTLVHDHYVPEPDRDAGSRTMLAFLEALLASGRVVKFFPAGGALGTSYSEALQQLGIEVLDSSWCGSFSDWIAINGCEIDEVLLSRPEFAEDCLPALEAHCNAPVVYYGHDLHHARMRAETTAADDPGRREKTDEMEARERCVWRAVDVVLYPSEEEVEAVRALEPRVTALAIPAYALPKPPAAHPPPGSAGIIFVAGFAHPPNVDAAKWLVRDILPLLRAERPDLRLALVGSNPTDEVRALAGDDVEVTGFVTDEELGRRYRAARVVVCPLRFGAGVKLKVIEAMHHGVPLVTTPVGAQGLRGLETVCAVHTEAEGFAAAVLRLLEDDSVWIASTAAQSAYVADRFTAQAVRQGLERAFEAAHRNIAGEVDPAN